MPDGCYAFPGLRPRARRVQMLTIYEQAVQNAFRETRDTLVAGEKISYASCSTTVQDFSTVCRLNDLFDQGYFLIRQKIEVALASLG